MPCNLTTGFSPDCREAVGGIVEFKVKAFPITEADFTITSGSVNVGTGSETGWHTYKLNVEHGDLTETINASIENQTLFYQQELKFNLNNLEASKQTELNLLAKNRLVVAVKLNTGKAFLIGLFNGAQVSGGTAQSGRAMGDRNGYEITLQAKSAIPMPECSDYNNLTT